LQILRDFWEKRRAKNIKNNKKSVNSSIYDADYYLSEGYKGDEKIFLESLDKGEYLYDFPIELAKIRSNEKVLDIGCGIGKLVYKALKKNCDVVGVDYSKDAIAIANKIRHSLSDEEQGRVKFINDDVLNMAEKEKFDVIFMTDVVEHLYDWQLKELFSKLETILSYPIGRIIIHTAPNRLNINVLYPLKRLLGFYSTICKKKEFFYKRSKYFYDSAMHVNEQTIWSLKNYLRNYDTTIWCEDFSKNVLSIVTSGFLGNHIWAVAKLKNDRCKNYIRRLRISVSS
jgi:2-polyprenyl-3-methyl-5-hydroxy-6-metoxy-1,4-benzoquinol methylase